MRSPPTYPSFLLNPALLLSLTPLLLCPCLLRRTVLDIYQSISPLPFYTSLYLSDPTLPHPNTRISSHSRLLSIPLQSTSLLKNLSSALCPSRSAPSTNSPSSSTYPCTSFALDPTYNNAIAIFLANRLYRQPKPVPKSSISYSSYLT
jgi:hypothetical protein